MIDPQDVALIVLLVLGVVSGLLRLNRGALSPGQRAFRFVITILMVAAAVVWRGKHLLG